MKNPRHPDKEIIKKYIWDELLEKDEIEIGEHLAGCNDCLELSRGEYKTKLFFDGWNAKTHGELYWSKAVNDAVESAIEKTDPSGFQLKLFDLIKDWKGKIGGVIQVLTEDADRAVKSISGSAQILFSQQQWDFAKAEAVRGIIPDAFQDEHLKKIKSKNYPGIEIITDIKNREVLIKIDDEMLGKVQMVMLIPEKEGNIIIAQPEKIEGTRYSSIILKDVPAEGYKLIFPPIKDS